MPPYNNLNINNPLFLRNLNGLKINAPTLGGSSTENFGGFGNNVGAWDPSRFTGLFGNTSLSGHAGTAAVNGAESTTGGTVAASGLNGTLGTIAGGISLGTNVLGNVGKIVDALEGPDTTMYENQSKDIANQQFGGNNAQLLQQSKEIKALGDLTDEDMKNLGYTDTGTGLLNTFASAGEGALAGAGLGPWGMIGGAAVGLIGGLGDWLFGNDKAEEAKKRIEEERRNANRAAQLNYINAVNTTDRNNDRFLLNSYLSNGQQHLAKDGGSLSSIDSKYNSDVFTSINNGGSHESNPYNGVQMGLASDGKPNLVEEGEKVVKLKDGSRYVMPNIKISESDANRFNLPKKVVGKTIAEASEYLHDLSGMKDTPTNIVSKNGNDIYQMRLRDLNEYKQEQKKKKELIQAFNNLSTDDQTSILNGLIDQEQTVMKNGGTIHIKPENRGKLTALKERTGKTEAELWAEGNPAVRKMITFARNARKWSHENGGPLSGNNGTYYLNNPFIDYNNRQGAPYVDYSQDDWNDFIRSLSLQKGVSQDDVLEQNQSINLPEIQINSYRPTEKLPSYNPYQSLAPDPIPVHNNQQALKGLEDAIGAMSDPDKKSLNIDGIDVLRTMPSIGSALQVISDLFGFTNKDDFSGIRMIEDSIGRPHLAGYSPVGRYLKYNPIDIQHNVNRLSQSNAETKEAIKDLSNGNTARALANLYLQDKATSASLGSLVAQLKEANDRGQQAVDEANNRVDFNNAQRADAIGQFNANALNAYNQLLINTRLHEAELRERIKNANEAARSSNYSTLFNNMGVLGKDLWNARETERMHDLGLFPTYNNNRYGLYI